MDTLIDKQGYKNLVNCAMSMAFKGKIILNLRAWGQSGEAPQKRLVLNQVLMKRSSMRRQHVGRWHFGENILHKNVETRSEKDVFQGKQVSSSTPSGRFM